MSIMLPSGISIRIREDLIDGASRTQTTLIIDPIVTLSGHRVTMADIGDKGYGKIDQGNSSEELMSWTGITDNTNTYTLTGCVWGINFHNLGSDVNNRKRHTSGNRFSINTDMHFLSEQYVSKDDFDVKDNTIGWGDGTDTDKTISARNGDTNEPFMRYDHLLNKWVISNDGVNTYDPQAGGSGLVAGHGIDINAGAIDVDLTELTTDTALDTTGGQLSVVSDEDTLLKKGVNGLYNDIVLGTERIGNENKIVVTNDKGALPTYLLDFGGTGADGELNVAAGTTSLDAGGKNVLIKNYTNLTVAVGATLTLTNTHANGTILIIRVSGNAIIAGTIDLKGKGATAGNNPFNRSFFDNVNSQSGLAFTQPDLYNLENIYYFRRYNIFVGAGGSGGNINGPSYFNNSTPGNGGGGLYLEVGGSLTLSGTIDVSGTDATNASLISTPPGGGYWSCGAGGGSVGSALIAYNVLISNTGTLTQKGGNGGNADDYGIDRDVSGGNGAGSFGAGGPGGNAAVGGNGADGAGGGGGGVDYPSGTDYTGGTGATTTKAILLIKNKLY